MMFKFFALKPWDERPENSFQVQNSVQKEVTSFPVFNNFLVAQPPPLPSSFGAPVQFVISTTESYDRLNTVVQNFLAEVRKTGKFPFFVDTDLKLDRPQVSVDIEDRKSVV